MVCRHTHQHEQRVTELRGLSCLSNLPLCVPQLNPLSCVILTSLNSSSQLSAPSPSLSVSLLLA